MQCKNGPWLMSALNKLKSLVSSKTAKDSTEDDAAEVTSEMQLAGQVSGQDSGQDVEILDLLSDSTPSEAQAEPSDSRKTRAEIDAVIKSAREEAAARSQIEMSEFKMSETAIFETEVFDSGQTQNDRSYQDNGGDENDAPYDDKMDDENAAEQILRSSREQEPLPARFTPQRNLGPSKKTDNLAHIRQDLAQLNEDMSTGEQFYAQSLKRISNLINYAYETEANLAALEQLEPENRRLTEMLEIARKTATDQTVRAESQKSKADAYEARYLEARQNLEKAQLSLTKLEQDKEIVTRELAEKDVEISGLKNSNRTIRNELTVDRKTQDKLSAKNLSLSSELSLAQSEKLELEKRNADLHSRYEQLQGEKEQIERMVAQTRSAQKATEEHNIALKAEIEQVLADVQVFKKQFDTAARQRDHEINALRATVSDLKAEVGIKTEVVSHAHEEMAELREKHDAAHRGRRKLLDHIEGEKLKFDALRDEAETAKSHTRTLYSQIVSLQADVDQLRRTNSMQSEKLAKYMALNTRPVSAAPSYPRREPTAPIAPQPERHSSERHSPERRSPDRPFQGTAQDHAQSAQTPSRAAATPSAPPSHYEPVAVIADPQPQAAPGTVLGNAARESARYGMVGGINADYGMGQKRTAEPPAAAPAAKRDDGGANFDHEFADLDSAGRAAQARPARKSEADLIDETLANFHEMDLLDGTN